MAITNSPRPMPFFMPVWRNTLDEGMARKK
jgi:hypothetical protein